MKDNKIDFLEGIVDINNETPHFSVDEKNINEKIKELKDAWDARDRTVRRQDVPGKTFHTMIKDHLEKKKEEEELKEKRRQLQFAIARLGCLGRDISAINPSKLKQETSPVMFSDLHNLED